MPNIYDYIDEMQKRPGMFTANQTLGPLETLLHGYCTCLHLNGIEEVYEGREFNPRNFSAWLYDELGWSGALGFAFAIEANTTGPKDAFDTFFKLVQQFRHGMAGHQ